MEHKPDDHEHRGILSFTKATGVPSTAKPSEDLSQIEFPERLKRSYTDLLTIEDEYEGLTSSEAATDVEHCRKLLESQGQQLTQLTRELNQEKSKLKRMQGDLEEAEVCLSMAQSYEAALSGWRESLLSFETLHREALNQQQTFSLADQAWQDLKHAEQQALSELDHATTSEVIHTPYGSTTVPRQEGLLPDEISIEILGDYLPVSILGENARLSLAQCQDGAATYAVHCL